MRLVPALPVLVLVVVKGTFARAEPPAPPATTDMPDVIVEPPLATPATETAPATARATATDTAPAATPAPPPTPESAVLVHVSSPTPVDLQMKDQSDVDRYVTVCTSPCDRLVLARGEYRVVATAQNRPGEEVGETPPSRDFALPANAAGDVITVEPRSSAGVAGGILLTVLGASATVLGLLELALWDAFDEHSYGTGDAGSTPPAGPFLMFLGGGMAMTGGIVLLVKSRNTRVSQSAVGWQSASGSQSPTVARVTRGSPWARTAEWREPSPEQRALPHAAGTPIFRMVF